MYDNILKNLPDSFETTVISRKTANLNPDIFSSIEAP